MDSTKERDRQAVHDAAVSPHRCEPIFSDEDADLRELKWCVDGNGYARRSVRDPSSNRVTSVSAHRVVLSRIIWRPLADGECCDHINGNRLDNSRGNLRVATREENCQHRPCHENAYGRGVRHTFDTPEDAAAAAAMKRRELGFFGETDQPFRVVDIDGVVLGLFENLAEALAEFNRDDQAAAISLGSYIVTRRAAGGVA